MITCCMCYSLTVWLYTIYLYRSESLSKLHLLINRRLQHQPRNPVYRSGTSACTLAVLPCHSQLLETVMSTFPADVFVFLLPPLSSLPMNITKHRLPVYTGLGLTTGRTAALSHTFETSSVDVVDAGKMRQHFCVFWLYVRAESRQVLPLWACVRS